MRALNWHLHAPESLRARKLSELLNSPPPADIRPTLVAQDMSVLLPQENMILTPPPPDGECGAGVDVPAALQAVLLGTPPSNRQTGLPPESELQAPTPPDYLRSVWNSKFDPSEPSDDSNPSVTDGSSLPSVPSPSTMDRDTEVRACRPTDHLLSAACAMWHHTCAMCATCATCAAFTASAAASAAAVAATTISITL